MAKYTHRLGKTRAGDGTRIWLEGKRLLDHGFTYRATCERKWSDGKLIVRLVDAATFEQLPRTDRTTVSGSATRPVIDIVGEAVRTAFPTGHIEATWSKGRISIKGIDSNV
jgi:hypothetical protein